MSPSERPHVLPLLFEEVGYETGGVWLLQDLRFTLEASACSVILGANGAGKTLLLRLCDGLLTPTRGRIRWLGPDARLAPRARALVFQRPVLLRRSAAANVDYALRLRGLDRRERERRVERVLVETGLAAMADRPAHSLSGGEQQRLTIARAWALEPTVLFLDEPASSLDPGSTRALERAIRKVREDGTKIVMTTHDLGQARRMADEILFLEKGRLLERDEATAFFAGPKSEGARRFLGAEGP